MSQPGEFAGLPEITFSLREEISGFIPGEFAGLSEITFSLREEISGFAPGKFAGLPAAAYGLRTDCMYQNAHRERFAALIENLKKRFSDRSHYVSLNIKLTLIVFLAVVLAVLTYIGMYLFESWAGGIFFTSERVKSRVMDDRYRVLSEYIEKNDVKGTDSRALQKWVEDVRYTQIVVYNGEKATFISGVSTDKNGKINVDGQPVKQDSRFGIPRQLNTPQLRIITKETAEEFKPDLYNRMVRFSDAVYYVYINVHNEEGWFRLMDVISVILAVGVFFVVILSYNRWILRRIFSVSDDVARISEGDIEHSLPQDAKDEIGDLVTSVEIMRKSLLEKIQSEQAAMDANAELITSMSHDIRTPLTALIGYLDIIGDGKYSSKEEFDRYIGSCKDKAYQLKGLSDKLFNYFLVFGQKDETKMFEPMDGGILFRQLIGEHVVDLERDGYNVNVQYTIPEQTMILVDIDSVMRVFDNLFSNLRKYASKEFPIEIKGSVIRGKIKLVLQNHIVTDARAVESTKIGVKTCRKICEDHHATFRAMEEERVYTTDIVWPVMSDEAVLAIELKSPDTQENKRGVS